MAGFLKKKSVGGHAALAINMQTIVSMGFMKMQKTTGSLTIMTVAERAICSGRRPL
jgi:hypothetical protein